MCVRFLARHAMIRRIWQRVLADVGKPVNFPLAQRIPNP